MTLPDRRLAGLLLHPTSLPGPHGSGDFGPAAFHFVDWLATAGIGAWQVLPLVPPGAGDSPYAGTSAFAGSPLLVALDPLVERGWLGAERLAEADAFDAVRVDFARVAPWRLARLREAHAGFLAHGEADDAADLAAFCAAEAGWLDDHALFTALDAHHGALGASAWPQWPAALARRDGAALAAARREHAAEMAFRRFVQWCFARQWQRLAAHAHARGVRLIGDLPIFVAHHSSDCWAQPQLFQLDAAFAPHVVAGVPPDAFSADGQRWGNPLYDWGAMRRDGFAWWIARLGHELKRFDMVRVDHFRGFAGCWEIPAASPTAAGGRWVDGPGAALFDALRAALGALPLIAEDLGVITPDVEALRDGQRLPGMKVLQFAFGDGAANPYLPHNHTPDACVYTGTHDNDTAAGWWRRLAGSERVHAAAYLGLDAHAAALGGDDAEAHWALVRAAWASVARLAVCQMQDVLGLGSEQRMNTPASLGCWTWRFQWEQVGPAPARRLAALGALYGRA